MPKVSVIIPTLDPESTMIKQCIKSVERFTTDYELIVVSGMDVLKAWNTGIKSAKGEYLVFLNDDTKVTPNWIEGMLEGFKKENAGVVGPSVEKLPNGEGIEVDHLWFPGSCFIMKRSTIDKVGYFDENLPIYGGDIDYWLRILNAGLKLVRTYDVFIFHAEAQTVKKIPHAEDMKQKNLVKIIEKHGFDPTDMFYGSGRLHDRYL